MKETLNYSEVPYGFNLCAVEGCPRANTCLRQMAYQCVPAKIVSLHMLNPKAVNATAEKCKYYCSSEKVCYAKGFICITQALPVRFSGTFRYQLIGSWGIRRYYQRRKGEILLPPAEQQQVVALAKQLGVQLNEYFDGYVKEYKWE